MRRPEGPLAHQPADPDAPAGDRIDFPRLNGLIARHRRQDGRQAGGHQALAAARTADQDEIVAAGRRDLHAALGDMLPADLPEIIAGRLEGRFLAGRTDPQMTAFLPPRQDFDGLAQGGDAINGQSLDFGGFPGRIGGKDAAQEAIGPGLQGHGQDAGHGPDPPVECQFAHDDETVAVHEGHLFGNGQQAERDGQVVGRPLLADVGRRQVDHQFTARNPESVGSEGCYHAKQTLPHRTVGQSNQVDPDPGRKIDFDRHHHRLDSDAGGAITLVEHTLVLFGLPCKDKRPVLQ